MQRLQKIIANNHPTISRRKAEELLEQGKIKLNGSLAKLGDKATESDKITIEGKPLSIKQENQYIILNKPKGILVTKTDPKRRKTIYDLPSMKPYQHLNYVGRLDAMSEGLLILTNDGNLIQKLTHPSHHITKTYQLRTDPVITKQDIQKLKEGILIETRKFYAEITIPSHKRDKVATIPQARQSRNKHPQKNIFHITIQEGRNRIIRKVMQKLHYKIFQLKRISVGKIKLENLKPGQIKEISKENLTP